MTEEELKHIPFHFVGHLSLKDEHCTTYESEDGRLGFCDHVPYKNGRPKGRPFRHYKIDGKVYKTTPKFIDALKEFDPKIIPIRKENFK